MNVRTSEGCNNRCLRDGYRNGGSCAGNWCVCRPNKVELGMFYIQDRRKIRMCGHVFLKTFFKFIITFVIKHDLMVKKKKFLLECAYRTRVGKLVEVFNNAGCNRRCARENRLGGSCVEVGRRKNCVCLRDFPAAAAK